MPVPSLFSLDGGGAGDAWEEGGRRAQQLGDASRASGLRYVRSLVIDSARQARQLVSALGSPSKRKGGVGARLSSFPQYPLTRLRLAPAEANALYQLSGWTLREHADELREMLKAAPLPD